MRARIDRVQAWLERSDVDVVALQETKCKDDQFPTSVFENLGYEVAHFGHSQWNGVAILSRVGLADVQAGFDGMPLWGEPAAAEARALSATCGGVRIWSLYVPNGRTLEDPHLATSCSAERSAGRRPGVARGRPGRSDRLVGDWNVAPLDEDVWSMAAFEGSTHVSAPERAAFNAVVDAGFADVVRPHTPGAFTYWDYQRLRFPKKEGMRIDFVLGSPALAARVKGASIDREERKGKGASDHAPVIVDLT